MKASGDTLTFKITEDFAPSLVLNLMTSIVASVVEKKVALAHETNGDMGNGWLKTNSAASGAFKLVSWKANESVSLEAYPGFRLGAPPSSAWSSATCRSRPRSGCCWRRRTPTSSAT